MSLFKRSKSASPLVAARKARDRKRYRKAIALYRQLLVREPGNGELHAELAPILARCRQRFDAWQSFKAAARVELQNGRPEKAYESYREAARLLPREPAVWRGLSDFHLKRENREDAIAILRVGARKFRRRKLRPQGIWLLRHAQRIEKWHPEATLELAGLLARSSQEHEADLLLKGLGSRVRGRQLRRVRAAQWKLSPTLRHSWLWLRSLFGDRGPRVASSVRPTV